MKHAALLVLLALALALAPAARADTAGYTTKEIALPGGGPDGVLMDYIAFDPRTGFVWVPAGNTGSVDVVDTATDKVTQLTGWKTQEIERRGRKRLVGPSSATVGDGVVYVGNRGDFRICAVDAKTLAKGSCSEALDSMPDGLAYVAATREVWVTTPRDKSIRILDAKTLEPKAKLGFEGEPEGFAVDGKRGLFYTNLEDKDRTVAVDLGTHKTVATWSPACGEDGPKGLALDEALGYLFVACPAGAEVVDAGHDGRVLSKIDAGAGVDNLDYSTERHTLYVGAASAAKLTVASVDANGKLTVVARVATRSGARNGVVTGKGTVYLADTPAAALIEATPKP